MLAKALHRVIRSPVETLNYFTIFRECTNSSLASTVQQLGTFAKFCEFKKMAQSGGSHRVPLYVAYSPSRVQETPLSK